MAAESRDMGGALERTRAAAPGEEDTSTVRRGRCFPEKEAGSHVEGGRVAAERSFYGDEATAAWHHLGINQYSNSKRLLHQTHLIPTPPKENAGIGDREVSKWLLLTVRPLTHWLPLLPSPPIHLLDKIIARKELMSTQLYFPWKRDTKQAQSRAVITLQVFRGFIGNY